MEKLKSTRNKYITLSPEYDWKNIDFPTTSNDWKKFKQDNKTIGLYILFIPYMAKTIRKTYKSEYNYKHYNQVILLIVTDGEK